jgi:hypothetical protein
MNTNETIQLRKETVTGFIDRGSNFRPGEDETYLVDRWVSDYFNVRNEEPREPANEPMELDRVGALGADRLVLGRETTRGFVDRGNNFRLDEKANSVADRWVSNYFNPRPKS